MSGHDLDAPRDCPLALPEWVWEWIYRCETHPRTRGDYARLWHSARCGEMPHWAGLLLFDALLEHNRQAAVKLMQSVLRVKASGRVDTATVLAANTVKPDPTLDRYFARRAMHYHATVLADSRKAARLQGWFTRLFRLQGYLLQ